MSNTITFETTGTLNEELCVETSESNDTGDVAYICVDGEPIYLDREATEGVIRTLTAIAAAHDAEQAAEAAKLKRGDVVRLVSNHSWTYTVTADEDSDGRVDLVCLTRWGKVAGDLVNNPAYSFERIPD